MRYAKRVDVVLALCLLMAALPSTAAAQASVDSALTAGMWAAQDDPRSMRLSWDHVPGPTSYTTSCAVGAGPAQRIGTIVTSALVTKGTTPPPRRSAVFMIRDPSQVHHCFLQWSTGKSKLSAQLPFNDVTPVVPTSTTRPPAPASLTAQSTGVGEITLTWSAVPGATAYQIGRAVAPDGYRTFCDHCSTRTTFVDRFAKAGAKHTYAVSALTPVGPSARAMSNTVIGAGSVTAVATQGSPTVNPALRVPGPVNASINGVASVLATWNVVPGAAGYELLRSVNRGAFAVLARVPAGSGWADIQYPDYLGGFIKSGSTQQVTVSYAVKAVDSAGAATAASRPSVELTIDDKTGLGAGSTSANASNTRATATSANDVTLTWSPPAGTFTCTLQRSLSGGSYAAMAPPAPGTARYVDSSPGLSTLRPQYRITCSDAKQTLAAVSFPNVGWPTFNSDGTGASGKPTAPATLRAKADSPDQVTLTWGPPTDPLSCTLQRTLGGGGTYTTLRTFPIGAWHYVDRTTGLGTQRPQYRLACGGAKGVAPVSFPDPY